jgi:hypothetical protein
MKLLKSNLKAVVTQGHMAILSANSTLIIEDYLKYPSQDVMFAASPEVFAIMTPDQVYGYNSGAGTYGSGAAEALK